MTHEIVDFGPAIVDQTLGFPFQGTEQECSAWLGENQEYRVDGTHRYAMQGIPE
jgi:hypothetical protein